MNCKHLVLNRSCKNCCALKAKWYSKLNDSGFDDIEKENEDISNRGSLSDIALLKDFQTLDVFEAKRHYYAWASSMLIVGIFKDRRDKKIWQLHIEGISRRKIAPKVGLEHSWISRRLKRIEKYLKGENH